MRFYLGVIENCLNPVFEMPGNQKPEFKYEHMQLAYAHI